MFRLANNNVNEILFDKLCKNVTQFFKLARPLNVDKRSNILSDVLFAPMQTENEKYPKKVSIIGAAGNVGQQIAYDLIVKRISDEIVLFDIPQQKDKLCGIGLDLLDGTTFRNLPKIKVCSTGENTKNSDLLVVCSGARRKEGQTRLDTLKENVEVCKTLIPMLVCYSPKCVILVVSNPVEVLSYAAWKFSGLPINRIVGSGTTLDSSRFRLYLSQKLGISPRAINAYIIGEHGESCVPCWSTINVAGTRLRDCNECFGLESDPDRWFEFKESTIRQGYKVAKLRGFTSCGIAMVVSEQAKAILSDKRTIYPVSTYCNGIHGFKVESFLSLPCVLGNRGIHQIIKQKLDCRELGELEKSACVLDTALCSYKW